MNNQLQEIYNLRNAGTLTWLERNATIKAITPLIDRGYEDFTSKFKVSGFDLGLKNLIGSLLMPYVLFNDTSALEEKELFVKLTRAKGIVVNIIETQRILTRQVSVIYRKQSEDDVAKFIEFTRFVFEALNDVCYQNSSHHYFQNMYKKVIDDWIDDLKIKFTPRLYKTQRDLANILVTGLTSEHQAFKKVFENEAGYKLAIAMLSHFNIVDPQTNKYALNKKQKGKLFAVIEALRTYPGIIMELPGKIGARDKKELVCLLTSFLKIKYSEFSTRSDWYNDTLPLAKEYIKKHFSL
jgi:hypothetical protein